MHLWYCAYVCLCVCVFLCVYKCVSLSLCVVCGFGNGVLAVTLHPNLASVYGVLLPGCIVQNRRGSSVMMVKNPSRQRGLLDSDA